ncbi:hypothetical protein [Streptomyces sp. BH104]|uniref:hypothetical protein n=1 Tax=unclassified Streptomyces TaxID=2593676 RepID=UPI003BB5C9CF
MAALAETRRVYAADLVGEPGRSVAAPDRPVRTAPGGSTMPLQLGARLAELMV